MLISCCSLDVRATLLAVGYAQLECACVAVLSVKLRLDAVLPSLLLVRVFTVRCCSCLLLFIYIRDCTPTICLLLFSVNIAEPSALVIIFIVINFIVFPFPSFSPSLSLSLFSYCFGLPRCLG